MQQQVELIDLSHTVEHGMITYKGLPAPIICDFWTREESRQYYAPGTEFHIAKIEMIANTGTYLDSPFHRYADGKDLSELPLASLANLEGVVIRAAAFHTRKGTMADEKRLAAGDQVSSFRADISTRAIDRSAFRDVDVTNKAVLIHTGWAVHWRTDQYFEGHPFLTEDAAQYLADAGAILVGIDSYNIDDTADKRRPVHSILLARGIPIVEHLCHLERLPDSGFRFYAVPVKVKGMGSFPVRAFAIVSRSQNVPDGY